MENQSEARSLTGLLKDHCMVQGETLENLRDMYKALTPEDKAWFIAEFEKMGFVVRK